MWEKRDIRSSKNNSAIKNFRVLDLALSPTPTLPLSLGHLRFPSYKTGGKTLRFTYLRVIKGHVILKHFEEEEKLPISSWHHVFHLVESQLPMDLAQEGLCTNRVAEPKSPFQISRKQVEIRRDVQEPTVLHWCKKRIRPNCVNSFFLYVQKRSSTPPETQHGLVCSYSHRFGSKICKHSRVTDFDCVWHCLGETHGHSTSPQETSEKVTLHSTHTHTECRWRKNSGC